MPKSRVVPMLVGLLTLGALAGACSSSSSKSSSSSTASATTVTTVASGDKAKFCADNTKLDAALAAASDAASAITILKANQATIHDAVQNAPSDIKANAQTLGDAADAAIAANDANKLNTPAVSTAGSAITSYCGLNPTTSTTA